MSEDIRLRRKRKASITQVSNTFIDKYMTDANGEFVKVYLYLLRCIGADRDNLSISDIADHFDDTEKDVKRALRYWEKMKLLHLEYDGKKLTSIDVLDVPEETEELPVPSQNARKSGMEDGEEGPESAPKRTRKKAATPAITEDEQAILKELLFVTETYLGKTLSSTEAKKIIYFYDTLGFNPELIEYLVEYCVSKNYRTISAMEKIALSWHEEGIKTAKEARAHVITHTEEYIAAVKSFGISGRSLNTSELRYLNKWTEEYHFTAVLIKEACERTIEFTHQASFKYADSIMESWFKKNVTSMDDVKILDAEHKAATESLRPQFKKVTVNSKFNNYEHRDYDYDAIEKQLLGNVSN
ncbi:MAG: DnaD domain protein [Lachnospiraceae bacterium]|nr:DnaD domain protein [Lachnospiraceae bacterium]